MSAYVTLLTHNIKYHDNAVMIIRYVMFFIAPTLFLYGVIQVNVTILTDPKLNICCRLV
jgi:hypothetical protein